MFSATSEPHNPNRKQAIGDAMADAIGTHRGSAIFKITPAEDIFQAKIEPTKRHAAGWAIRKGAPDQIGDDLLHFPVPRQGPRRASAELDRGWEILPRVSV
jgi:hypothetical protein